MEKEMLVFLKLKEGKLETFMGWMQSDEGMGVRKSVAYPEKTVGAMIPDKSGMLFKVNVHNEAGMKEFVSGNNPTAKAIYAECVESAQLYELSKIKFDIIKNKHIFKALKEVYKKCEGGFAVTMIVEGVGLVAFRDANGIRPLVVGKKDDGSFMVASESSALSALGYDFEYDVDPGGAVIISEKGVVEKSVCSNSISHSPCLFEFVYFSALIL